MGTSGNIGSSGKKSHSQSRDHASGGGTSNDELQDDEEESMDWWTKYFASVDAMIEVNAIYLELSNTLNPQKRPADLIFFQACKCGSY